MAGRKWRGRASGKQCQEYIPQVSAWVPALTICSALGLATLPLAVTNPGWTVSPLALSTNAIGGALCSTCWWPHSIRANSTSAGILLWLVPMAALALMLGWAHPLTQMSGFFTKAALMTFGGAYAVLPYVYQGAVTHYGWLTAGQMMDGLALGESTPGPLIMVVTFVGFVGDYTKAVLGVDEVLLGGIAAACLVTWFTFCPRLSLFSPAGRLLKPPIIKWDLPRRWPPPR
ncbi:hypothetical protein SL69_03501 [Klebsiella pneumoniae]|nr:hypothetical protein SL69_03501 [Klebsiella pneumoniae]SBK09128.1 putative chromate transporter [Klebsiella pneumoniae]